MACGTCKDHGFVYDDRCINKLCAHIGELVTTQDKNGVEKTRYQRVMACPGRACPSRCPVGLDYREGLRDEALSQHRRFRAADQLLAKRGER